MIALYFGRQLQDNTSDEKKFNRTGVVLITSFMGWKSV